MLRALSFSSRCSAHGVVMWRGMSATALQSAKAMPPRPPPVNEDELTEVFLKGSGPGGQKIRKNKTSSAVQLKHLPTGIVLKVQATRSREQNRKLARQMLADRLEVLEKGAESRVKVVAEVKKKRKSSAEKKSRRKYKALASANDETGVGENLDKQRDGGTNESRGSE